MKTLKYLNLLFWLSNLIPSPLLAGGEQNHEVSKDEVHADHQSEDGEIVVTESALSNAKITVSEAGPATIFSQINVNGRVSPITSNVAHIASRFSGVIRAVTKDVGDTVASGDVLAVIESNQNLQRFEVRALKQGIVTDRHATVGESIKDDETLFVVMDLREIWAEFPIFQRDISKVKVGQKVEVYVLGHPEAYISQLTFISPIVEDLTQSRIARAVLGQFDGTLAPGAFITGKILVGTFQVPIAVSYEATQTLDNKSIVFVQENGRFKKREITVGKSDGTLVEILAGIRSGEKYAATNSFVLKAELGKNEAEHEH